MYKLTFWDCNIQSCRSGTVSVFVDSLEEFEKCWIPKMVKHKESESVERYFKSKKGELITDYYKTDNDEELNIVQEDRLAKVLRHRNYVRKNTSVNITNGYGYSLKYYFKELKLHIRYIKYNGGYYKVASFDATGGCYKFDGYNQLKNWGNPFIQINNDNIYYHLSPADRKNVSKVIYEKDRANLFVWRMLKQYNSLDDLLEDAKESKRLTNDELDSLLSDLPGEEG